MEYQKIFDPQQPSNLPPRAASKAQLGDRRDGLVYVYTDEIVLAVNVALATGRPLLVRGPSGCGKSSLARNVAENLGWRYYEKVISSRTQARDLLWEVDLLRRLQDAQTARLERDLTPYVNPGVLWWAFDRESARRRGAAPGGGAAGAAPDEPGRGPDHSRAVVLLDEIDKADPDVPNNLLVPLGSLRFRVEDTGFEVVARAAPLVLLTTNDERELPSAFQRRCVELRLGQPTPQQLLTIGRAHFGRRREKLLKQVAELIMRRAVGEAPQTAAPSSAEYLDTVRACLELKVEPGTGVWEMLSHVTVWKHGRPPVE